MLGYDLPGYEQTETCFARVLGDHWIGASVAAAVVSFEDVRKILFRDAFSGIPDGEYHVPHRQVVRGHVFREVKHVFMPEGLAGEGDEVSLRCVAQRVVDQIRQDLIDPVAVRDDGGLRIDVAAA